MSHLGVDNKFKTKDVVPVVSALLSGKALDAPKEKPKTEKVDGRTKEYKNAVKRMDSGGRRKDGPDCRTKGYRATVARIAARATKNTVEESTQLDEMFSGVVGVGADDAVYITAVEVEEAKARRKNIAAGSVDVYKCFDQLIRQLVGKILDKSRHANEGVESI